MCAMRLSCDAGKGSEPQLPVSHMTMMANNWYIYNHSVPICPFSYFSTVFNNLHENSSILYYKIGLVLDDFAQLWAPQVAQLLKNLPVSAGGIRDMGSIPGLGRPLGEGNGSLSSIRS